MAGYLRELARVVAAARGVGAGANASAKAVFGAVSAARKGVERRDLEVRLLALPVLTRPTLFQYSYSPGAAAVLLLLLTYQVRLLHLLATYQVRLLYSSFLRHPASYCDAVQRLAVLTRTIELQPGCIRLQPGMHRVAAWPPAAQGSLHSGGDTTASPYQARLYRTYACCGPPGSSTPAPTPLSCTVWRMLPVRRTEASRQASSPLGL